MGAALLWPSGVVQHGGVVLGPKFAALHAFDDRIESDPGYTDLLRVAHECGAVTAACLLTERRLFLETGGFDEYRFPVNFNDVDYFLRLRAGGLRVVLTPHARLLHRKSALARGARKPPRPGLPLPARTAQFARDLGRDAWTADIPLTIRCSRSTGRPIPAWPGRRALRRRACHSGPSPVRFRRGFDRRAIDPATRCGFFWPTPAFAQSRPAEMAWAAVLCWPSLRLIWNS